MTITSSVGCQSLNWLLRGQLNTLSVKTDGCMSRMNCVPEPLHLGERGAAGGEPRYSSRQEQERRLSFIQEQEELERRHRQERASRERRQRQELEEQERRHLQERHQLERRHGL